MRLILASASPRRKELLKEVYPYFEILPAQGEEKKESDCPEILVAALARAKAKEVFERLRDPDCVVLGADTVVAYGQEILGKPKDTLDARRMLNLLSGNTHRVLTGVCFLYTDKNGKVCEKTGVGRTNVTFYPLDEAFIERYIQGGSPMDKAGAYGIQDGGLAKNIDGSYSNVVGLPVELCQNLFSEIQKEITE